MLASNASNTRLAKINWQMHDASQDWRKVRRTMQQARPVLIADMIGRPSAPLPAAKELGPWAGPHCDCCPAPAWHSQLTQWRGSSPQPELQITPNCRTGARCPHLYTNSLQVLHRRRMGAVAPHGARGRAPAASRLPACAARAGATASLSPSVRRAQAPAALAPRGPSVQPKRFVARSGLPCTQHIMRLCGAQG